MPDAVREGDCELCGEQDVKLYHSPLLEDNYDGIACLLCATAHEEAHDLEMDITHQQKMDM